MRLQARISLLLTMVLLVAGCHHEATGLRGTTDAGHQVFVLKTIAAAAGKAILSGLEFRDVEVSPDGNALLVSASEDELPRITAVLELVDTQEDYAVETLVPLSAARDLPTNQQIAGALGNITIGTFAQPPTREGKGRAIIDIHHGSVVALIPCRFRRELIALVELGPEVVNRMGTTCESSGQAPTEGSDRMTMAAPGPAPVDEKVGECAPSATPRFEPGTSAALAAISAEPPTPAVFEPARPEGQAKSGDRTTTPAPPARTSVAVTPEPPPCAPNVRSAAVVGPTADQETRTVVGPLVTEITVGSPTGAAAPDSGSDRRYSVALPDNGHDTLVLDLPEQLDVLLLLDLAAQYLHLDCLYDPAKLRGQSVTLKLRGKLQGEITVGELYPLLESVLRFRGFAMTRGAGNLVTIVPEGDVLTADPELIRRADGTVRPGEAVVTRVLELKHMDATSAKNLLENMNLGLAVSPVEATRTVVVTCYADRMARIEQLLEMIDSPGRPKKVRFRQLQYITATMLAEKVRTLAEKLQTVSIAVSLTPKTRRGSPTGPLPPPPVALPETSQPGRGASSPEENVYLDADERTNRILMVGYEEHLNTVGQLVDAFDVPSLELRTFEVYPIAYLEAGKVQEKLTELGFGGRAAPPRKMPVTPPPAKPSPFGEQGQKAAPGGSLVEEPDVVVLEATNALLASGTREQHTQLAGLLTRLDRPVRDPRTLRTYALEHVEARDARDRLAELQVCSATTGSSPDGGTPPPGFSAAAATPPGGTLPPATQKDALSPHGYGEPQVVAMELTNSLLVNASPEQHARIENALRYIDIKSRAEEIPYKVYPLTNSAPSHLAQILESLIQEKVKGDDGKIVKVVKKQEDVAIVPDPNTYSLIVYASKKNQDWIANLINQLDKRKPQVLIDVTLVEITQTDAFSYDLNLLRSVPDLDSTSGITGAGVEPNSLGRLVQIDGGLLRAFYGDEHIRVLLQAIQSKKYGRILAKPKILVNDNEPGVIKTADTTYVQVSSSVPVSTGGAGTDATLIQTAVKFEPYEAGITLNITPHINRGEELRLDVELERSDFRQGTFVDRPPDTTSSHLSTSVFVPDGSTIILGGLLKMNQNRGSAKVPILGDIPLLGGLFRSIQNSDTQSKLYVFLKAEIIQPTDTSTEGMKDLETISDRERAAFEEHEQEFQSYKQWPGIKPKPTKPAKVLEAR